MAWEGSVDLLEIASTEVMEFLEPDFFGDFDGELAIVEECRACDCSDLFAGDVVPSAKDEGFGGLCGGRVVLYARFLEGFLEDSTDTLGGG